MGTQEEQAARLVWQYGEPIHAVVFFAPETRAATDGLGLKGGWMSYFGCRAAPLGAVSAAAVTSIFYGFHPRRVERAIPDAWSYAQPRQLIDARLSAMDAALGRLLGEAIDGPDVQRAASLATAAVHEADFAGRPLGAANAALADPAQPHLQLWQALGALREHRGDGHVTCLVANQVEPCESLVVQAATGRSDRAGTEARDAIEAATDRLAAPLVAALGTRVVELVEALRPLAERIMSAGAVPTLNNMGLPWPSQEPDGGAPRGA